MKKIEEYLYDLESSDNPLSADVRHYHHIISDTHFKIFY